jgi:polar amino acid transport system substrate-binding protein
MAGRIGMMTYLKLQKVLDHVICRLLIACVAWLGSATTNAVCAQSAGPAASIAAIPGVVAVPGFWDPKKRPDRPDLSRLQGIRFLTEDDFPPFNHAGPDGRPAGFNVDLARLVCEELGVRCTVQVRRFDTLITSLEQNAGDAVIASVRPSADLRRRVDMTDPYFRQAARFAVRAADAVPVVSPQLLEGRRIGVVMGTAHEAYLTTYFPAATAVPYASADAAREALRKGELFAVFADGVGLAYWINGTGSENCCAFAGGPYIESRFFGEGIGMMVRRGNDSLRNALNYGLFRLWETGRYTELWLRYFPVSPY